jgi:predicted Ser/Thr protein kinase
MSNTDRKTTSDFSDLLSALDLKPVTLESEPFGKYLQELSEHPERADTAHGLLVRAVEGKGEVEIDKEPEERRPYLRMLKQAGIKLYVAFDHVRGSHRFAHKMMQHLLAASANGYQLFLAIIIKGPPGSGKSMFVDAIKACLEGQIVYTVDGCPVHENPLNLLKLLSDSAIDDLAAKLGLTEDDCEGHESKRSLRQMLAVAGDPCQHCWSQVMESKCEKDPNKALLALKVTPMRLSARKFGVATWTANCSLPSAMERGSRGMVDMGELFDGSNPLMQVSNPQLKILLDATNDRRIPGNGHTHGPAGPAAAAIKAAAAALPAPLKDAAEAATGASCAPDEGPDVYSYQPLDAVLFGQTNMGAWDNFIKSLGKDAGKFTRRFWVPSYPYNSSVTEEEMAYRDRIALMRDVPHFDPMSLMLLSLLAVVSRLKPEHAVDIVERARIYDGERLEVKRTSSSVSGGNSTEFWTVQDLWREAAEEEALTGLDMTVMFNMLSEIIDRSLREPRFEECVSSYEMITFLRARLAELEKSDGFTEEQKTLIKRCREKFLAPAKSKTDKPGAIEAEYRRILQRELYEVAAPDFERRARKLFERYRAHVQAFTTNKSHVDEEVESLTGGKPRIERVKVDTTFMGDLEGDMGINWSDREAFRAGLETNIFAIIRERRTKDPDDDKAEEINWETLPTLAKGIRKKLNNETRKRLERLLKTDLELQDETEDDRRLRAEMIRSFNQRGYCTHCLGQALEYFKLNELWALQS